nr:hypothetical protein CFP56_70443 [Quercus suber]
MRHPCTPGTSTGGKVKNIPSTSLDEFGDDFIKMMYGDDNNVLSRMFLPPSDVPPTTVDGEILNLLRAERAWLIAGTWILDFLVRGQICPP